MWTLLIPTPNTQQDTLDKLTFFNPSLALCFLGLWAGVIILTFWLVLWLCNLVLWHIPTNKSLSNLCRSGWSVGLNHTRWPLLLLCINEPWVPNTLSPIYLNYCWQCLSTAEWEQNTSLAIPETLWPTCHNNLTFVKVAQVFIPAHSFWFPCWLNDLIE